MHFIGTIRFATLLILSVSMTGPARAAAKVLFEDSKMRLVEVSTVAGEAKSLDTPYPAIIATDASWPTVAPVNLGGTADGSRGPTCLAVAPQKSAAAASQLPAHYYRIEFKRIDGSGLPAHWREWYPWMQEPLKPVKDVELGPNSGGPLSAAWPFPAAFDSYKAAPNNHYLKYQDSHVRFLEVVMRADETENMHGHPYPSVFANDTGTGGGAFPSPMERGQPAPVKEHNLDPTNPRNSPLVGKGAAPQGLEEPTCTTMDPQAPHAAHNLTAAPIHFYRLEFIPREKSLPNGT
jgi:hypothetical protein